MATCPLGHELISTCYASFSLKCDHEGCGRTIRRGESHLRCEVCDYDLCNIAHNLATPVRQTRGGTPCSSTSEQAFLAPTPPPPTLEERFALLEAENAKLRTQLKSARASGPRSSQAKQPEDEAAASPAGELDRLSYRRVREACVQWIEPTLQKREGLRADILNYLVLTSPIEERRRFSTLQVAAQERYLGIESAVRTMREQGYTAVHSADLVVNELVLEVDARFGPYGRCNVCENGTDHHGDDHCADGSYVCNCGDSAAPEPCGARVGFANLTEATTKYCVSGDQDWRCWQDTVIQKVEPAAWYSTTAAGHCDGAPEGPCAWRVANVSKVVNKTCADGVRFAAVEALGAAHFANCSSGAARNASSHCWLAAFFATVLGPGCSEPGCVVRGAPLADLEAAWARPFRDVAAGGCPDLTGEG